MTATRLRRSPRRRRSSWAASALWSLVSRTRRSSRLAWQSPRLQLKTSSTTYVNTASCDSGATISGEINNAQRTLPSAACQRQQLPPRCGLFSHRRWLSVLHQLRSELKSVKSDRTSDCSCSCPWCVARSRAHGEGMMDLNIEPSTAEFVACAAAPSLLIVLAFALLIYAFGG